jgi:hypothetical protein
MDGLKIYTRGNDNDFCVPLRRTTQRIRKAEGRPNSITYPKDSREINLEDNLLMASIVQSIQRGRRQAKQDIYRKSSADVFALHGAPVSV